MKRRKTSKMKLENIKKMGYKCNDCRHYDKGGICKNDYLPKSFQNPACENFKIK